MMEKETYALAMGLLKLKSGLSGSKVTVFTDDKALASWYKEGLCTMGAPLGRRGRWSEVLSGYNMVVHYKAGKDNDVAAGLSRRDYPAGLASDTNFQGSDQDLRGVVELEDRKRARNEALISAMGINAEPQYQVRFLGGSRLPMTQSCSLCSAQKATAKVMQAAERVRVPLRTL